MTTAYEMALNESREAFKIYDAACIAYRAMKIGDVEFLAAQADHKVAIAKFDAAFEIEASLPEEVEVTVPCTHIQTEMF